MATRLAEVVEVAVGDEQDVAAVDRRRPAVGLADCRTTGR